MSSGKEIDTSILEGLLKSSELRNEKYLIIAKEGLFKDSIKSLFDVIKKSNDKTNKEKKKAPKIPVLKEDKQAFGIIARKPTNLNEVF